MGKEARAACRWGAESGMVTASLEGDRLFVRGDVRANVARSAIRAVSVEEGELRFLADDVPVTLALGTTAARRWANAISDGPPTLETKLGIEAATRVRVYGTIDDAALEAALATAGDRLAPGASAAEPATLAIVRADGGRDLETALATHLGSPEAAVPLWVVYRKGKNVPLNEAAVRAAGRARGLVDTKVAGISATLSAMRFFPRAAVERPAAPTPARTARRRPAPRAPARRA